MPLIILLLLGLIVLLIVLPIFSFIKSRDALEQSRHLPSLRRESGRRVGRRDSRDPRWFSRPDFCSTGQDNPLGLFGYITPLDIGLLMVARVRKWLFLATLGAACTILMQFAWFADFFESGRSFEGLATWTAIAIGAAFMALFLVAALRTKQDESGDRHPGVAAMTLRGSSLFLAFLFLG